MIQKLRNISYEMCLKECGLTLETKRLRGDHIDRTIFFSVKEDRRTRGHGVTLTKSSVDYIFFLTKNSE